MARALLSRLVPAAGAVLALAAGLAVPMQAQAHWVPAPCDFITSGGYVFKDDGAMANFSRYIRPGDRFLPVDDADTVVAVRPDGQSFVVVHVNPGLYERRLDIDFSGLKTGYRVTRIVTDQTHRAVLTGGTEGLFAPPLSVTTFIVTARS